MEETDHRCREFVRIDHLRFVGRSIRARARVWRKPMRRSSEGSKHVSCRFVLVWCHVVWFGLVWSGLCGLGLVWCEQVWFGPCGLM